MTFVAAGIIYMGFYAQRAQQGRVKSSADNLGSTFSSLPTQGLSWSSYRKSRTKLAKTVTLLENDTEDIKDDWETTTSCSRFAHVLAADRNSDGLADGSELPFLEPPDPCDPPEPKKITTIDCTTVAGLPDPDCS